MFSQDDYFGVYAFFNSLDEPLITVQTEQESAIFREHLKAYRVRRAKLLKAVAASRSGRRETTGNPAQSGGVLQAGGRPRSCSH